MIAKCSCQHCGIHIEFEAEDSNQVAPCPSCGKHTRLQLPSISSKAIKAGWKFNWKRDWPKVAAAALLFFIVTFYIVEAIRNGASGAQIMGTAAGFIMGLALLAFVVFIVVIVTREQLWLSLLSVLLFLVGTLSFVSGVNDWFDVFHRENATIMQQQLAAFEMLGGAVVAGVGLLVYIGQRILKTITNRK